MIGLPSQRREKWTSTEMDGSGVNFVRCLVESLWYIDSHHHIFEKQRCSIPAITKYFTGYNACEASKQKVFNHQQSITCDVFTCFFTLWLSTGQLWKGFSEFANLQPHVDKLENTKVLPQQSLITEMGSIKSYLKKIKAPFTTISLY